MCTNVVEHTSRDFTGLWLPDSPIALCGALCMKGPGVALLEYKDGPSMHRDRG